MSSTTTLPTPWVGTASGSLDKATMWLTTPILVHLRRDTAMDIVLKQRKILLDNFN